jgi:TetR/AcrR family transcriptional regulator, fatty acid metabolism regulator protein
MNKNQDRKDQIINAAIKVFAEKGFYNSKVADVARAAGIADGTIYLYFKNKDDLLISLFETKMEQILLRFNVTLDGGLSATEKLSRFIHLHFQMIEEDRNLAEVFQVELRQSSKFLKDYHNQKFIDFLNMIGQIVKEGQQNGEFRSNVRINTVKLAIFGAVDEIARQWLLTPEPKSRLQEIARELIRTFLTGLTPHRQED